MTHGVIFGHFTLVGEIGNCSKECCVVDLKLQAWNEYDKVCTKYDKKGDMELETNVKSAIEATQVVAYVAHLARACNLFLKSSKSDKDEARDKFEKHSAAFEVPEH